MDGSSPELQNRRRTNTRNGYSKKRLKTSHGTAQISIPRDREGDFAPRLVPKHRSITQTVEDRVIALYAAGLTTREIQSHVEELYHFEASEMFVSRLVERLEPELVAWRSRPLEALFAVVFVDGFHLKVRHSVGVRSTAAYLVTGYGESGERQVLGLYMADEEEGIAESASYWLKVLHDLSKRGLQQMLVVCADGLSGLEEALQAAYPQACFQPCVVHLMRNSLKTVPYAERKAVARALKTIYQAPSYEAAELALEAFGAAYGTRYRSVLTLWRAALPRLSALWNYSSALRRLVYTTNPIESLNRQLRKVVKTRGVLPSTGSALRLLTLALMRIEARPAGGKPPRARPDWGRIVAELHILFKGQLPEDWGYRHQ
jgi:transposase-like protein